MKLKRINESIASEFVKKDEEETKAGVIEPANKEKKVLEPVNDEVHVAAVDGLEQNKEAAKEVVEDSTITKNAEELVKEESKEKHESLNVKSRVELAKLISEAKKNNQTYKISKCLEEGYRYTFEITGTEKLAEDLEEDPATLVVDLSDSGEGDPEIIPEVKPEEETEATKEEKSPLDIIKDKFDVAVIGGEDGSKIIIAVKGDLEKEESPKLELPVTEEEFVILSPQFAEPVKEFLDANVSVGSNNSMDGNTGVGLEVPVDVQANGNDATVGGATTSVLEAGLKEKDATIKKESLRDDKKELDYLWAKEKVAPLDKYERFRIQELIQKYGRPDNEIYDESLKEESQPKEYQIECKFNNDSEWYDLDGCDGIDYDIDKISNGELSKYKKKEPEEYIFPTKEIADKFASIARKFSKKYGITKVRVREDAEKEESLKEDRKEYKWYTGDYSDEIAEAWKEACDELNVWSEPSIQAGQGIDIFRENGTDKPLYEVDFGEECEFMDNLDETTDWADPNAKKNVVEAICGFITDHSTVDDDDWDGTDHDEDVELSESISKKEEVFAAEEEEIPVDDDFFGEYPEPIYDDEVEGEEKVLEVKPEEIKETEVLSKFGDFEPAEDVKEFWELVKESGKLDDLEFFLDEFDIDDNEKLADFLANEDHRDYLLSALGLGADIETFEDDEVAPVDYDKE